MKKFFALMFAFAMTLSLVAGAAFAEIPADLPAELAALAVAEDEEKAAEIDMQKMSVEEMQAMYDGDGKFKGLTYTEVKEQLMKGFDGVVIEYRCKDEDDEKSVHVRWSTAEKKLADDGKTPVSVGRTFELDSESGRYLARSLMNGEGLD